MNADPGYYVPDLVGAATVELPCPLGTYTDSYGLMSCFPCDAGSYG